MRRQLKNIVAAVAERQPVGRHAEASRQRRLQLEAVGVGIAPEVRGRRRDGAARRLRHAERVLVEASLTMPASSSPNSRATSAIGLPAT